MTWRQTSEFDKIDRVSIILASLKEEYGLEEKNYDLGVGSSIAIAVNNYGGS